MNHPGIFLFSQWNRGFQTLDDLAVPQGSGSTKWWKEFKDPKKKVLDWHVTNESRYLTCHLEKRLRTGA